MIHKDFVKYWREKQSNKYFSKSVPKLNNRKTFTKIINLLSKEDFRKLDYDEKLEAMQQIFGDNKEQYSETINKEIANAITIGKKHV